MSKPVMINLVQAQLENVKPHSSEIHVRVHLHNTGKLAVDIPSQALNSPSLLFELIDKHGENIFFAPPPVPDPRAGNITIDAGQHWQADFINFLPVVPTSTYQLRVCLRGEINIVSDWLFMKL